MNIYNTPLSDDIIAGLVKKIKEKKEFKNVDDVFCIEKIRQFLLLNKKMREKCALAKRYDDIQRSAEVKMLVKEIRAFLRSSYGLFQRGETKQAYEILQTWQKKIPPINELLELHVSTKERLPYYKKFFTDIFQVVGNIKHILDIGCGYNPVAVPWMKQQPETYTAVELYAEDVALIKQYFEKVTHKTKLEAHTIDVEKKEQRNGLYHKKYDLVFALKLFDLLKKKTVEDLVRNIRYRWLAASFSTKTIAGKRMNVPRRGWFQKMLRRLGYSFTTLNYENELVYLVRKENKSKNKTEEYA